MALAHHIVLEPFGRGFSALRTNFATALSVLMAMVGLVLFIACANVAILLLARCAARQGEMAIRLSVGAGRARLIRQLLTESVLLALAGGAAGVVLAHGTIGFLAHMATRTGATTLPPASTLDVRVLGFAALLSLVTGILFGVVPALRATQTELGRALKAGSRNVAGGLRLKGMRPLVVLQVMLSLLLLVGAGLFTRSLRYLSHIDVGFEREQLLAVWIDTKIPGYPRSRLQLLYHRLTERLEAVPGIRSASVSMCGLDSNCDSFEDGVEISGYQRRSGEQILLQVNCVGLKYFETAGMRLVEGRDFGPRDEERAPKVAIVNQEMARRYFANRSALGQRFGYRTPDVEIIGVVRDGRVTNVASRAVPMVYYPMDQNVAYAGNLDVRVAGNPGSMKEPVRRAIAEVDPDLPVRRIATVAEQIDDNLDPARAVVYLTSAFGFLALALACVGVYGVMSYAVMRRTAELGIRMALGASGSNVLWIVLRDALVVLAIGLALGLPAVLACSRFLSGMLFGLSASDPATFFSASLVLAAVVICAGYLPALRAARINPMVALRHE